MRIKPRFRFTLQLGNGNRLHLLQRAEDYLAAEAHARSDLARTIACGESHRLVLSAETIALVSPETLVYRDGPMAQQGRALGGEWWDIKGDTASRIVNGDLLSLSWRDTHSAIEWTVLLNDRVLGTRREGDFFPEHAFWPFEWADAMKAGYRVEMVDGRFRARLADGTLLDLQ